MSLSGNNCSIVTIFELGVSCQAINPSTPIANDGSIQLIITGGTPPYNVSWSNGQQGITINNLSVGSYSGTVVDYYGDYTGTTVCSVSAETFFINQYYKCDSGGTISSTDVYTNNITGLTQGNVYTFNETDGCYYYSGRTVYTGQTYSSVTIDSQFDDCTSCVPEIPTPPTHHPLCLTDNQETSIDFVSGGTDVNGNLFWTATTSNGDLTLSYDTEAGNWEVSPWYETTGIMIKIQSPPQTYPVGEWYNAGNRNPLEWSISTGSCVGIPLTVVANTSTAECEGGNGSVELVGNGGTPPYTYSIDGYSTTPQVSGLFILPEGNYTGRVIDSDGTQAITNFSIISEALNTEYTITILQNNPQLITNVSTIQTKKYDFEILITPALPAGVTVSFDVQLSHNRTEKDTGDVSFFTDYLVKKNGSNLTPVNLPADTNTSTYCTTFTETQTTFTTIVGPVEMIENDVVTGSLTQSTVLDALSADCECPTVGDYDTALTLINVSIDGGVCDVISQNINTIQQNTTKTGCAEISGGPSS